MANMERIIAIESSSNVDERARARYREMAEKEKLMQNHWFNYNVENIL